MANCGGCGRLILGPRLTALQQDWHPGCFRCAGCAKPIAGGSFVPGAGRAYHPACYREHVLPRCSICGQPLATSYELNAWGEHYCANHSAVMPRCFSCQRLIPVVHSGSNYGSPPIAGVKYDDGRHVCAGCRAKAVISTTQAMRIIQTVRLTLAAEGLDLGQATTPVRLVYREDLQRLGGHQGAETAGLARCRLTPQSNFGTKRDVEEILVLYGLSDEHFAAIAAHELGHAWLFLQAFPGLPPLIEEGFCQLCSFLWLQRQKTAAAAFRIQLLEKDADPVYGAGFRAARAALRGRSPRELAEHIRRNKQF